MKFIAITAAVLALGAAAFATNPSRPEQPPARTAADQADENESVTRLFCNALKNVAFMAMEDRQRGRSKAAVIAELPNVDSGSVNAYLRAIADEAYTKPVGPSNRRSAIAESFSVEKQRECRTKYRVIQDML